MKIPDTTLCEHSGKHELTINGKSAYVTVSDASALAVTTTIPDRRR